MTLHNGGPKVAARINSVRSLARLFARRWNIRRLVSTVNVLILLWVVVLHHGERSSFNHNISSCDWSNWETWPEYANPHHLVFVADPQLVDPHTYPGRPWPLSTLTVFYTDLYLLRSFTKILKILRPDTIIFLGDLFDGGREWSTSNSFSPEEQWRSYGQEFWLKEYKRFSNLFFRPWADRKLTRQPGSADSKLIASLPGNHDLGFGSGVQKPVRSRFNAYFGEGNRIDVIANHTFVSLDTVSLSALGADGKSTEDIWKPPMDFLDDVRILIQRAVRRELRLQSGRTASKPLKHDVSLLSDMKKPHIEDASERINNFPSILLSHVPLYRAPGTPCGPLREHWPPSPPPKGQAEPLEFDERNAIAVRGGYQYQNVLALDISKKITEKIGDVRYAFSGDDHDYCEVRHHAFPSAGGGIREITVKSISWAMGVRKPGFLMVSLWNPVQSDGETLRGESGQDGDGATLKTNLCLLPDQLSIFIRYGTLLFISIITLFLRAAWVMISSSNTGSMNGSPVLPFSEADASDKTYSMDEHSRAMAPSAYQSNASHSTSSTDRVQLAPRSYNARTRSVSPGGFQTHEPLIDRAGYFGPPLRAESDDWGMDKHSIRRKRVPPKGISLLLREFCGSLARVGVVVIPWYLWLIWTM